MRATLAKVRRRDFLAHGAAFAVLSRMSQAAFGASSPEGRLPHLRVPAYTRLPQGGKWRKGNLHMHTLRSDGLVLPMDAAALYKRAGYDFICLTDHNVTAADAFKEFALTSSQGKRVVGKFEDRLNAAFPGRRAYTIKKQGENQIVVPATFAEVCAAMQEPERFLVISGNELTAAPTKGKEIHCGAVNFDQPLRAKHLEYVDTCFHWMKDACEKLGGNSAKSIFILNHPLWVSYDVSPRLAADCADLRFFEVCNSDSTPRFALPGPEFTHDKWWDVVNAIRASRGMPLIYGVATDDNHTYGGFIDGKTPPGGHVQVLSPRLTTEDVVDAMYLGNFYASTGLELESVRFDVATRTLTVRVSDKFADDCIISFIGSEKGVDTEVKEIVEWEAVKQLNSAWLESRHFARRRQVERFSSEIGKVFKTVKGREASYTMQGNELYVRAKVVTSAGVLPENQFPKLPIAWTQPVRMTP